MQDKKIRLKQYKKIIDDVALEISQSKYWRELLFKSNYNQKFLISSQSKIEIPYYINSKLSKCNLQFYVSKVLVCPEEFDSDSIIFEFEAVAFPNIKRYSAN